MKECVQMKKAGILVSSVLLLLVVGAAVEGR